MGGGGRVEGGGDWREREGETCEGSLIISRLCITMATIFHLLCSQCLARLYSTWSLISSRRDWLGEGEGWAGGGGGGLIMGSERVIHRPLGTAGIVTAQGSVSVRGCGL